MYSYLDEHQQMAVRALEQLQEICDRHHLRLYLLAGTVLGAVRHKGMIPWDDDIDVGFTYKDWYRIRKILSKELSGGFEYKDYLNTPGFPRLFGKILYEGQNCVDIFLIAKYTSSWFKGNLHWQYRRFAVACYKFSIGYRTPSKPTATEKQRKHGARMRAIRYFLYLFTKPFCKTEDYLRFARWNERFYEKRAYDCYVNLYSIYKVEKERIKKEWVEKTSKVEFEGKLYTTVGDTDAYLTHLYGDYMTPPPVSQRKRLHGEVFK